MSDPADIVLTRTAYDTVAASYAELLRDELDSNVLARALLAAFAELVDPDQPVGDLGCGPGRVTAHLAKLGLDVFGVDLSPSMVEIARESHPELRFSVGSITDVALADHSLGGVLAWYSIIHLPPERLPEAFAEFHRVLRPGGMALLGFQVGDERVHLTEAYGHPMGCDVYRLRPERIIGLLEQAGFHQHTKVIQEPMGYAKTQQCLLLISKPEL